MNQERIRRSLHFVRAFFRIRRGQVEFVRPHYRGDISPLEALREAVAHISAELDGFKDWHSVNGELELDDDETVVYAELEDKLRRWARALRKAEGSD